MNVFGGLQKHSLCLAQKAYCYASIENVQTTYFIFLLIDGLILTTWQLI